MKAPVAAPFLAAALASLSLVAASIDLSAIPRKTTNPKVPGAYIVELDSRSVGPGNSGKRSANVCTSPMFFHSTTLALFH